MSRKRRMFDIEMPDEDGAESQVPADPQSPKGPDRRGPMASAVRENADSLRARAEAEHAIRAENDALAHEYVELRKSGLILARVPVQDVHTNKLTRDRRDMDEEGLAELRDSIRAIGLSNPIHVERAAHGYELVQGLRRLTAFRALFEESGDARFAEIPAVVLAEGETIDRLYRRMVDENLIRTDISFAEMAMLAKSYAADAATEVADLDAAVQVLFNSAGKQKKSYIRAFARLLERVGDDLRHPQAIPRALGLSLRNWLDREDGAIERLRQKLGAAPDRSAEEELAILKACVAVEDGQAGAAPREFPAGNAQMQSAKSPRRARTTFQIQSALGTVKCTASQGRLELRLDADLTALDRRKLEDAVARLLSDLQ